MRPIRKILAALDETPRAAGVLIMADEMARRFGASLHLFRAIEVSLPHPPAAHTNPDDFAEVVVRRAEEELNALAARYPGASVEKPILSGREPWRDVLDKARALDADLIVIGSHVIAGWDRLLRTNTAYIAEQADRHVFVVHSPAPPAVP